MSESTSNFRDLYMKVIIKNHLALGHVLTVAITTEFTRILALAPGTQSIDIASVLRTWII